MLERRVFNTLKFKWRKELVRILARVEIFYPVLKILQTILASSKSN